ncbi:MAG: hypothetical protein ACLSFJ_08000, partial [Holdemania filiformis]
SGEGTGFPGRREGKPAFAHYFYFNKRGKYFTCKGNLCFMLFQLELPWMPPSLYACIIGKHYGIMIKNT